MRAGFVTRARGPHAVALVAGLASAACGGGPRDGQGLGHVSSAIIEGTEVDAPNSPVLFLSAPGALCSATLVGPRVVATARHCVAPLTEGSVSCTPEGDLSPNSPGGQLGPDFNPSQLTFFLAARATAGVGGGIPDAVGMQTFSTGSPNACRDDIAFVVIDRVIPGVVPAPVRLTAPTADGELVSLWGYGLTEESGAAIALRAHDGAQVIAVGPSTPVALEQPAPLRAVRVGPGTWTCNGDSGGPVFSQATGALIAVISLGVQASPSGPYCSYSADSNTTGPRLAEYGALAAQAFAASGDNPTLEYPQPDAGVDAAAPASDSAADTDVEPEATADDANANENAPVDDARADDARAENDASSPTADADTQRPSVHGASGSSCIVARGGSTGGDAWNVGVTMVAMALWLARRRRR